MRRLGLATLVLLLGCARPYALAPGMERPVARWGDGAMAARTAGSTELLPYRCPEGWMFVRELGAIPGRGTYEVYGCAREAIYECNDGCARDATNECNGAPPVCRLR